MCRQLKSTHTYFHIKQILLTNQTINQPIVCVCVGIKCQYSSRSIPWTQTLKHTLSGNRFSYIHHHRYQPFVLPPVFRALFLFIIIILTVISLSNQYVFVCVDEEDFRYINIWLYTYSHENENCYLVLKFKLYACLVLKWWCIIVFIVVLSCIIINVVCYCLSWSLFIVIIGASLFLLQWRILQQSSFKPFNQDRIVENTNDNDK